ncbi:hypothetical protein [uncultured Sphingomonas sp.]|uniref:hypothetical protein n=1 Tax=uncultured Sphingomonas sp. TaxID=158754 RepID=UPI002586393A|nr:hypothetical protein [uncultured Sphingomonas sp.]
MTQPPRTPDGRYIVVDGVLWRATRPDLPERERETLVHALMDARRAVGAGKRAGDDAAVATARKAVDAAKVSLGERGPVWWNDDAPDYNRHKVENTPYAGWWAGR